ncbi:MAG: RsmB/NOP family class I SAM-dependent RNA methyltransferase [bacterium]|nr:RsmB/NOP family class I SAM-dependent RNA methyltransferase [bacterium]
METLDFHPDFVKRVNVDPFLGTSLLDALNNSAPISVRRNPKKIEAELPTSQHIDWCEGGFFLSERPSFTLDPLFHAGSYYPQEAGSMVIDTVLRQLTLPESPVVLDLCGAPGGKSTLVLSYLNNQGLLVSNEVIQSRARILKENSIKWGFSNSIVTNNDPSEFQRLPNFFDVLLVDAPCSGEGMFRKDPTARKEWSEDNVKLCAARQKRILGDVWSSLKPGGLLIYSTCTFNENENEQNVTWMQEELGAEIISLEMPSQFQKGRGEVGHYAIPGKTNAEGFYIAALRKNGEPLPRTSSGVEMKGKKKSKPKNITREKDLSQLTDLVKLNEIKVWRWKDFLLALPEETEELMLSVSDTMRIVKLGTELGTLARKGFVPSHDLSMNVSLRRVDKSIELNRIEALKYLKGETFALSGDRGMQMVTYNNEPLGWIKHLGNRFNNGYPKEWRIKMKLN